MCAHYECWRVNKERVKTLGLQWHHKKAQNFSPHMQLQHCSTKKRKTLDQICSCSTAQQCNSTVYLAVFRKKLLHLSRFFKIETPWICCTYPEKLLNKKKFQRKVALIQVFALNQVAVIQVRLYFFFPFCAILYVLLLRARSAAAGQCGCCSSRQAGRMGCFQFLQLQLQLHRGNHKFLYYTHCVYTTPFSCKEARPR